MRTGPIVSVRFPRHELLRLARKKPIARDRPIHLVQLAPHGDPAAFDRDKPRKLVVHRVKAVAWYGSSLPESKRGAQDVNVVQKLDMAVPLRNIATLLLVSYISVKLPRLSA